MKIFSLLLALTLFACAHRPQVVFTSEAFRKEVEVHKGKKVTELIDIYGYPQRTFNAPQGFPVFEYRFMETLTAPAYAYSFPYSDPFPHRTQVVGGETYVLTCLLWFEMTPDGKSVSSVRFKGDACKAPVKK